jgi:hypothetical protein
VAYVPETVLSALAAAVAEALPVIEGRVPPGPAAELGRLGVPREERPVSLAYRVRVVPQGRPADPVTEAQRELGPLVAERLLGALELTIAELDLTGAPDLSGYLPAPQGQVTFAFGSGGDQGQTGIATAFLQQLRPGAAGLAVSLTRQLAGHRLVAPLLATSPEVTGEAAIAAGHGAAHLALAVAVAGAVVREWPAAGGRLASVVSLPLGSGGRAAAVVGVAIGAATLLLGESPMPAGYAAALLEKVRAEYLLPARGSWLVEVSDHRFALTEGEAPATADFSGNGLVAVVPGGALIRTGAADGHVTAGLEVVAEEPELQELGWDEVVEVSWRAAVGQASLPSWGRQAGLRQHVTTPPWPGDYRLRVHATGRDDPQADERYELVVWQAPAGPEIVHKRTDALGYQLRGEPQPARPPQPEHAYRWVDHSQLQVAATVTVVTGAGAQDVLRAFGADPALPESMSEQDLAEPGVAVLDIGGAVLAIENNGFRGTYEDVLREASASGRAASMFWNVNALTQLSFAEGGQVLAAFEPGMEQETEDARAVPPVAAALDGLDFDDHRDYHAKGLVAVERFTGHGFTQQDLERIEEADIAYRLAPD